MILVIGGTQSLTSIWPSGHIRMIFLISGLSFAVHSHLEILVENVDPRGQFFHQFGTFLP